MRNPIKGYILFVSFAILSGLSTVNAQCNTTNLQSNKGGAISCNFPFLSSDDVQHYISRLQNTDLSTWLEEKEETSRSLSGKWETKNLRVLLITNTLDAISQAQLDKLKLAINLHLVDIAQSNTKDDLDWSHMPIVEEIILEEYPDEFKATFDMVGFLIFADPDPRNGEEPITRYVRSLAKKHNINTIFSLQDAPMDIPFKGAAQVYCTEPGPYMNVSIRKSNTIALSDKYLVQLAQAFVHEVGHTNNANHQIELKEKDASNQCHQSNFAEEHTHETLMCNGLINQKNRKPLQKPFGISFSKTNAQVIIDAYINRGLLRPLFNYSSEVQAETLEIKVDKINIFPNPVSNLLNVEMDSKGAYDLSIFSLTGKLVNSQRIINPMTEIDFTPYESGTYILEFFCEDTGEKFVKKLEKLE